ncbi:MAG TPA: class I SAM-dependent methyltransferase [Candidatus Krumholzibacteria bacterium]|nr:class I SAM-dependent methyltransferase [Candidatus Krumholzibacteria bacterium]
MHAASAATAPAPETRFEFGKNWLRFLGTLDEDRIDIATRSLASLLGRESLSGASFLDIGSGSGLSSLAALRLGCTRLHSFDFDPLSVACTQELKRRYARAAEFWTVEAGNALDRGYLAGLGTWDVVYSWGVLHHTGALWQALDNVAALVRSGGSLCLAIYNDQGSTSVRWRKIKALYHKSRGARLLVLATCTSYFVLRGLAGDLLRLQDPTRRYRQYRRNRGMSVLHDWRDWLGGYPFEVAKPEAVLAFYRARGFTLERMTTCGGSHGCNEYAFVKQ